VCLGEISDTLNDDTFIDGLKRHVNVSSAMLDVGATVSKPKNIITSDRLAKTWGIGIEAAKRTRTKATTQRGVRSVTHPSLTRRFRTNDRQLRYRRLNTNMYTDTMFSTIRYTRGNVAGQVYVNDLE
jgi:hypothetical protein